MLKSYFLSAWRNLIKNKANAVVNVGGLAVGMAVALLIGLWIEDEMSFDKNFSHYDRIAQVMQSQTHNGEINTAKGNVMPLAAELRRSYGSDFKHVVLSSWSMNSLVSAGEQKINCQGNYMETGAPDMLSLRMLAGSRQDFRAHSSILISASVAKGLFGKENPIGKVVMVNVDQPETVAGVYEDFPASCSFRDVQFIAPFLDLTNWVNGNENNWYNESFQVFVQLSEGADMTSVSNKIRDIKLSKITAQEAKITKPAMLLYPMSRWHLYGTFKNGVNTGGAIQYVDMFAVIGFFVLLLACINFMNLTTARSEKRAKEVGIRKAIGSLRSQLIGQFFAESILVALLAFLVALGVAILVLPAFNVLSQKQIHLPWNNLWFWIMSLAVCLATGLLAGVYPAFYLSSFRPVKVLKGSIKAGRYAALPRRILVVVQFSVSIILIIGTIVVFRQVQFARSRPMGYSKEGLITMIMQTYNFHSHFAVMRDELMRQGIIEDMAESNTPVTESDHFSGGYTWEGMDGQTNVRFNQVSATQEYGHTVGLEFVSGRDFSKAFGSDSTSIILNETAARYIGFKNPVGQTIRSYGKPYTIIGVVKDLVMESPYEAVKPTIFNLDSSIGGILNIRLSSTRPTSASLSALQAVCKRYSPEEGFSYLFADEQYALKFYDEERVGRLSTAFAALAIFISCLGIFGMASFMAEQRVKEIGVRKVMGASVASLWGLLSRDFVLLVMIAMLIGIPVARYFMYQWLMNYQYRAGLSWWIFAATGAGALLITILTVSIQTVRAAQANPIKSLRSE